MLPRDIIPLEDIFLQNTGFPSMRRNWLFHNTCSRTCSRVETDKVDSLHQTTSDKMLPLLLNICRTVDLSWHVECRSKSSAMLNVNVVEQNAKETGPTLFDR